MSFGKTKDGRAPEPVSGQASVHPFSPVQHSGNPGGVRTEAFLGQGSTVKGTLTFDGPVQIDGAIEGEINAAELLTIGQGANVKATVNGSDIVILGTVHGDIHASRKLSLRKPARVTGNISSPAISIEEGVEFEGTCSMKGLPKAIK